MKVEHSVEIEKQRVHFEKLLAEKKGFNTSRIMIFLLPALFFC
jgi:hypothetical protein